MTEKEKALQDVRQAGFAMIDAGMFLDSHPTDETALQYFHTMHHQHDKAVEAYETHFGPLHMRSAGQSGKWDWIDEPWPWEGV